MFQKYYIYNCFKVDTDTRPHNLVHCFSLLVSFNELPMAESIVFAYFIAV